MVAAGAPCAISGCNTLIRHCRAFPSFFLKKCRKKFPNRVPIFSRSFLACKRGKDPRKMDADRYSSSRMFMQYFGWDSVCVRRAPHPSRRGCRDAFPSRGRHRQRAMHDFIRGGPCPLGLPCGTNGFDMRPFSRQGEGIALRRCKHLIRGGPCPLGLPCGSDALGMVRHPLREERRGVRGKCPNMRKRLAQSGEPCSVQSLQFTQRG